MTAKKLARILTEAGIIVCGTSEWTDVTDASITLEGNRHVQIAGRFMVLNQWVEDDQAIWPLGTFKKVEELISALKTGPQLGVK